MLSLVAIGVASLMLPFSVTGGAITLSQMTQEMQASPVDGQWMLNTFNIAFAALPLAAGTVADLVGRRRVLSLGVSLVGLAAIVVALAPSMPVINTARAVQGCGAACILASGAAILAQSTPGRRRVIAFGILGTAFGSGLALGPLVAGALSTALGWRSVFVFIAVCSLIALVCGRWAPESRNRSHPGLDWAGLLTFTGSLTALTYGFISAGSSGWLAPGTVVSLIAALLLLASFVGVELRHGATAMLDVRMFRNPSFVAVMCQPFTVTLGFVILLVYLPDYLQGIGQHSLLVSAAMLLPMTLPVLLLPLTASALAVKTSHRFVLTSASLLIALGSALLVTLTPDGSWIQLAIPLLPFGIGVGLAFGVMDNAAVSVVTPDKAGTAAGIFNNMRITGESLAVALAAAFLTNVTAAMVPGIPQPQALDLAERAIQGDVDGAHFSELTTALTQGVHVMGCCLAASSVLGAALTVWALSSRRANTSTLTPGDGERA